MKTLRQAQCGETVTVTRLNGEGALKRRIMDMGITKAHRFISARLHRWGTRLRLPSGGMSFRCAARMRKRL